MAGWVLERAGLHCPCGLLHRRPWPRLRQCAVRAPGGLYRLHRPAVCCTHACGPGGPRGLPGDARREHRRRALACWRSRQARSGWMCGLMRQALRSRFAFARAAQLCGTSEAALVVFPSPTRTRGSNLGQRLLASRRSRNTWPSWPGRWPWPGLRSKLPRFIHPLPGWPRPMCVQLRPPPVVATRAHQVHGAIGFTGNTRCTTSPPPLGVAG